MEVLLLAIFFLPLFLLFISRIYKLNLRPPGPRGLPLIGNMHQFDTANTHLYLYKLSQKHGPLMSLKLGTVKYLVISSASAAREVFKYHDLCFSSRPASVGLQKMSYKGLDIAFAPYSLYWREMRKICTLNLFSSKRSQSFQPIREQEVARMVKSIRDEAAAGSSVVNLSETLTTLTSSVIFKITFGKIYDDEEEYGAMNHNKMSSKMKSFHWLLTETQAIFASFFLTEYFPIIGHLIDRLSGAWSRVEKSSNKIDAFYQQVIDEYLHSSPASTHECSILDILLQMKKDSSDFTFDHIKAILMNVLVAGSDTSAAAVVWAMTLLIKNPSKMKKVQQEVRDITGNKGFVDENDVQKLVYLKAVVKEAMRWHPPLPLLLPYETIDKCVISGYQIEAKTRVYVNAYAIGRDPECYEDPDEFLPERFMNSNIDFKGHHFELIPFGAGRRMCPGISMGVATTELALANLLYSFNWKLPPGKIKEDIDMATATGLTVHKKNHLCLVPVIIN
ncbi:cytochrome P450 71A9-like [Apium graveolens]|uniref:cytochrome P450 71A9-like n=1 Tax=Apium graveolens TaxID=4045 RepID=UPI003D79C8C6